MVGSQQCPQQPDSRSITIGRGLKDLAGACGARGHQVSRTVVSELLKAQDK
jgi:hypothetical protein